MAKSWLTAALIGLLALLTGQSAAASSLSFSIRDGKVTIIAKDVTVREILVEWQRIGRTTITNLDKLRGPRVTLELREVPEAAALVVLLRSVGGYVTLPRAVPISPGSVFQSILILPSSSSPAAPAPATARAPSPGYPLPLPAPAPVSTMSTREMPSPRTSEEPVGLNGPVAPGAANVKSASSPRFVPLSPAELSGARLTRQRQQDVVFGRNNTPPAGSAPPLSTDASRPGTVTTVAPGQNQQPGTPRR